MRWGNSMKLNTVSSFFCRLFVLGFLSDPVCSHTLEVSADVRGQLRALSRTRELYSPNDIAAFATLPPESLRPSEDIETVFNNLLSTVFAGKQGASRSKFFQAN